MEVQIEQMNSTVRATDMQALLNPQLLEQIVRIVLERVREARVHEERTEAERRLRPGVSAREGTSWR